MKILCLLMSFGLVFSVYAANQFRAGTTAQTIAGTTNISDIDTVSYQNMTDPIGRLNANYQEGCKISYASASTITVGAGEIVLQNSAGTIFLMQQNASATTVAWTSLDTGSESASTTYFLWAYQETATDEDFDVTISTSSSAPSGKTYYARLGSFYNDSSSNITRDGIDNDNNYYALHLGDWLSKSNNVSYLASTDGEFFACGLMAAGNTSLTGYTDSSNPPTTARQTLSRSYGEHHISLSVSVKRGDYYKVTGASAYVYWIPSE